MRRILLVEPDYRSKFPPLGLMRIATYHKAQGDAVTFVRGRDANQRSRRWHRIYVASLFTWELPRTVKTVHYYRQSVSNPMDIVVGGIGATLMPDYVRNSADCTVVTGLLDSRNKLERGSPILECEVPDYGMLDRVEFRYSPTDAYFLKATKGCVHKCKFCAVPKLEPDYKRYRHLRSQVNQTVLRHGELQHMILLDNNVLAHPDIGLIVNQIRDLGFGYGAKHNDRLRYVDFNQGIDARIIAQNPAVVRLISSINLSPVRLAFDTMCMEDSYGRSIELMAQAGFREFTNYMLYNYTDTPEDFYTRLQVNMELAETYGVNITGFPMRYVPINDVSRQYVSPKWKWRYLRGIRCILLATHGLVGTNPNFVQGAFGRTYEEFIEIVSMPDRYIIYRTDNKDRGARSWRRLCRQLSASERLELMDVLEELNARPDKREFIMRDNRRYRAILRHYYPAYA